MDHRPSYAKGPHKSGIRKLYVANPDEKAWHGNRNFLLWFGAYGVTRILVYATSVESALETAAEYCVDRGWLGLVTPFDKFYAEAEAEHDDCNHDSGVCSAEADQTYTESGFIPSWEWGICAENLTPAQISDYYHWREP